MLLKRWNSGCRNLFRTRDDIEICVNNNYKRGGDMGLCANREYQARRRSNVRGII